MCKNSVLESESVSQRIVIYCNNTDRDRETESETDRNK